MAYSESYDLAVADKDPQLSPNGSQKGLPEETSSKPPTPLWIQILFTMSVALYCLGAQAMYDAPAAMGNSLLEHYDIDNSQYGLLYSLYALPNLLVVVPVGVLVDRIGPSWSALIFNFILLAGGTMMAYSGDDFDLLLGSFIVFGLGASSIFVSQLAHLTRWFHGSVLALTVSISTAAIAAQAILDYNLTQYLVTSYGVTKTWYLAWGVAILSFLATVLAFMLNRYRFKHFRASKSAGAAEVTASWPKWKDFRALDRVYWLSCAYCVTLSITHFLFLMYAVTIFEDDNMTEQEAGLAASMASVATLILAPLFARLADKKGRYGELMFAGAVVGTVAAAFFLADQWLANFANMANYITSFLFGVSYAIGVSVAWSCVAPLVDMKVQGTAYGLMNGLMNFGLFVFPYLIGALTDYYDDSNIPCKTVLLGISVFSLLASIAVIYFDRRTGHRLQNAHRADDHDEDEFAKENAPLLAEKQFS